MRQMFQVILIEGGTNINDHVNEWIHWWNDEGWRVISMSTAVLTAKSEGAAPARWRAGMDSGPLWGANYIDQIHDQSFSVSFVLQHDGDEQGEVPDPKDGPQAPVS